MNFISRKLLIVRRTFVFLFPGISFLGAMGTVERMKSWTEPLLLCLTFPSFHGFDSIEVGDRSLLPFHLLLVCSLRY